MLGQCDRKLIFNLLVVLIVSNHTMGNTSTKCNVENCDNRIIIKSLTPSNFCKNHTCEYIGCTDFARSPKKTCDSQLHNHKCSWHNCNRACSIIGIDCTKHDKLYKKDISDKCAFNNCQNNCMYRSTGTKYIFCKEHTKMSKKSINELILHCQSCRHEMIMNETIHCSCEKHAKYVN